MVRLIALVCLWCAVRAEDRRIEATEFFNSFHNRHKVLLRIRPGDRVITRTVDAFGRDHAGKLVAESPNPLTGPFFVEGAAPGDAIAVTFHKIAMNRKSGFSSYRLGVFSLSPASIEGLYPNRYRAGAAIDGRTNLVPWELDLQKKTVKLREPASRAHAMEFPASPMLGCVGVAAPADFGPSSSISGPYGGNMDYNQVVDGATVILPVFHPGALLFIGDGHALQGDGEPTGTGIETSMDVEFSVQLLKSRNLGNPRLENAEFIVSIGSQLEFASPLDRALQIATTDMANWLVKDHGMEPWAAHQLIGMQARYDVITVAGSVGLKIPRKALPAR